MRLNSKISALGVAISPKIDITESCAIIKNLILKQKAMKKIHENLKETRATKPLPRVTSGSWWLYSSEGKWIFTMTTMEDDPLVAMGQTNINKILVAVMIDRRKTTEQLAIGVGIST